MPECRHEIPTFEEAANDALALDAFYLLPDTIRDRRRVLDQYVLPHIGPVPVSQVTCQHVLDVLRPIWREKPAQARKVKTLIRRVADWAIVSGYRTDTLNFRLVASALGAQPNPVPCRALAHSEVGSALTAVRESNASRSSRLALEFLVLTAARSGEVRDARWDDIDVERGNWIVSQWEQKWTAAYRPLSSHALRVLDEARDLSGGEGLVFPGRSNRPFSRAALSALLRGLGIEATPHSFRASFCQWCADTGVPQRDIDLGLGHVVPHIANIRPYLLQSVRDVMEVWGDYVSHASSSR